MPANLKNNISSKIVGVTYDDPRSGLNRQKIIRTFVKPGSQLEARLESDNEFDPNAVALWFSKRVLFQKSEYHLGYMTKTINERMAGLLREGRKLDIRVKELTGGTKEEPSIGVNIVISF